MGTSGIIVFVLGTQRRAVYCHFDSYPEGLGRDIVRFILGLKPEQFSIMHRRLQEIEWVKETVAAPKDLQQKYRKLGYSKPSGDERETQWYWILRGVQGGDALLPILNGDLKHLVEVEVDFNNPFAEYSYFLDFQKRTLETWCCEKMVHTVSFQALADSEQDCMEVLQKKLMEEE
ncbi:uncharacterized protein EAE98_009197 [Botrytis deweyae]|uniref:Uncharacterized protein n=1 Tax=Botrytis deweyae TaxID=2478750 RepID=A0ABQ7ID80_9HELO|nr:uncharacterized protein EAE98_009197 [Botrytis deweyae]KAF7919963.1 hypothetical protein EAE98_009197 [Botrytis deweyae]